MLNGSNHISMSRRIECQSPHKYNQSSQIGQVVYYPNAKVALNSVKSLEHISSAKLAINRSQDRIGSMNKVENHGNIYTTHKKQFNPFGIKM